MDTWRYIFIAFASGIGVLFITWLTNRKREGVNRCKTGPIVLSTYVLGFALFSTMTLSVYYPEVFRESLFEDPGSDEIWLKPFSVAITGVFLFMFVDGLQREIKWDADGIIVTNLVSSSKKHGWDELKSLNYRYLLSYWEMGFADGTKFRFSDMMTGGYALLSACEEHAKPESNIDIKKHVSS